MTGQMMEPCEIPPRQEVKADKPWAADGNHVARGEHNRINAMDLQADVLEAKNEDIQRRLKEIAETEVMDETVDVEDADIVFVAYGTSSRAVKNVLSKAKAEGLKMGLIRPISLWPFPTEAFDKIKKDCKAVIAVEQSCGQMVEDVRLAVLGRWPVEFYGRSGGNPIIPDDVLKMAKDILGGK